MTDNEIIKALECCCDTTEIDCSKKCPLYSHSGECWGAIKYDVFNLIKLQKAEIERLVAVVEKTDAAYFQKVDEVNRAKAEAVKEFAEMLKWKATATHKTVAGHYRYEITNDFVDDLVKEMVGDGE